MATPPIILRCRLCGAPLRNPTTYLVACHYCEADNVLPDYAPPRIDAEMQTRIEAARIAAREAEALLPEIEHKSQILQAQMTAAVVTFRTTHDPLLRSSARSEALRSFEAFFRLHQMPGLLIAGALGPAGQEMFERVDAATVKAIAQFTRSLDDPS